MTERGKILIQSLTLAKGTLMGAQTIAAQKDALPLDDEDMEQATELLNAMSAISLQAWDALAENRLADLEGRAVA